MSVGSAVREYQKGKAAPASAKSTHAAAVREAPLRFSAVLDHPYLFPLSKAALEPCDDVRGNYSRGLSWLRAQQLDPMRPKSLLQVHVEEPTDIHNNTTGPIPI